MSKKIVILISIFAISLFISGCTKQTTTDTNVDAATADDNSAPSEAIADSINQENDSVNTQSADENTNIATAPDDTCAWIDASDVIIQLDLPETYAHDNDATVFPSYPTGFLFKSSYGEVAESMRLARKSCDYRVGFSKEDFANLNIDPSAPLVIKASAGTSMDFTYTDEPMIITLENGLPKQGASFNLTVDGEVASYNHYNEVFN